MSMLFQNSDMYIICMIASSHYLLRGWRFPDLIFAPCRAQVIVANEMYYICNAVESNCNALLLIDVALTITDVYIVLHLSLAFAFYVNNIYPYYQG